MRFSYLTSTPWILSFCKRRPYSNSVFKLLNHPLEDILNYRFSEPELLRKALLHPSHPTATPRSEFQRLEFLGDRVLNLVLADLLVETFPAEQEGTLTNRISCLVSAETCREVANTIQLDNHVHGIFDSPNTMMLADAMESLLGAMYLDGGMKPCHEFISKFWGPLLPHSNMQNSLYKSNLQMWLLSQEIKQNPVYTVEEKSGPEHEPHFKCSVAWEEGLPTFYGTGNSKKAAELMAAKAAMDWVTSNEEQNKVSKTPTQFTITANTISKVEGPSDIPSSSSPNSPMEIPAIDSVYKNRLQEIFQGVGTLPIYTIQEKKGFAHKPLFNCSVSVFENGVWLTLCGEGYTKKSAEQMAARNMLVWLDTVKCREIDPKESTKTPEEN